MYHAAQAARRIPPTAGRGVRVLRRHLTTEATSTPPKKKPRILRRIFWATAALTGTFYAGSTFVAFKYQPYYDLFSDHVPLGQSMLEFAESHGWDTMTTKSAWESTKQTVSSAQQYVKDMVSGTPTPTAREKVDTTKQATAKSIGEVKDRIQSVASQVKTGVQKRADKLTGKAEAISRHQAAQFTGELMELVREAEDALKGKLPDHVVTKSTPSSPVESAPPPDVKSTPTEKNLYDAPLPVGFEPPPGYVRPAPPKREVVMPKAPSPPPLPRLSPELSSVSGSEPIIAHLAGTIDDLTSYIKSNPEATTKVAPVLQTAKGDLSALVERIDKVRQEERALLEAKMDEQSREYTIKLLELEMSAQDKLDDQELEFRKFFDQERVKLVQAYKEKLDNELKAQTELINERLKEEVIAQGIELQRRWIREIKVRVEQERGGRLAKIDELSTHLKRLERIALDNSTYLDENIRIHALWSAIRAVSSSALSSPVRRPFREELRVLRHITAAREDPVVSAALDNLESSEVPDVGIEPFADLASWFSTSVAPKVSTVALVPDQDAGLLSHLASQILSRFQFKRHGLVEGKDVLSVLSRAEYHLNEKDLDSAARELNQLKGTAKMLLQDWLDAARKRLEVQQALEVVQTQATLASLLVV